MTSFAERRAARLLRWYPREWRTRYGDEFKELLVADLDERPHSARRGLDVARGGVTARLAAAGLGGRPLDATDHGRRSLVTLGAAFSVFAVLAMALWAQLTIGWQWSPPDTVATSAAMVIMTAAVAAFVVLGLAAAAPIGWLTARSAVGRGRHRVLGPVALSMAGLAVLIVGTHHFANGWPGTRGHPWADQGLVPGGVAAYAWASTLFVTSYWLHPGALGHFPGAELAWMATSPLAVVAIVVGALRVVRGLELSPPVLRYEKRLGVLAAIMMAVFLLGAALWVVDGGPGPQNLFHIGSIDVIELVAMALLVLLAKRAAERVGSGAPPLMTG